MNIINKDWRYHMNNLVSIIIPVYNVEQYLNRCISSIVNQTYPNLQIILVDDGSPDNCPKICDLWKKKDSRIEVIHKENGGLSSARNAGLHCAKGDYVLFVDSDDWISINMIEEMIKAMNKNNVDMVVCQFVKAYPNGKVAQQESHHGNKILNVKDTICLLLYDNQITNHVWRNLYKRNLLPNNLFPEGMNYEDVYVMASLFLLCKKILYLDKAYYYYFQNNSGIVRTITYKNCCDHYRALENSYSSILKRYPNLAQNINEARKRNNLTIIINLFNVKDNVSEAKKMMKKLIKENIHLSNNRLTIKEYIIYYFFGTFPCLYFFVNDIRFIIKKVRGVILKAK